MNALDAPDHFHAPSEISYPAQNPLDECRDLCLSSFVNPSIPETSGINAGVTKKIHVPPAIGVTLGIDVLRDGSQKLMSGPQSDHHPGKRWSVSKRRPY